MQNVTHILAKIDAGDSAAAEQLLPLVYDELRRLASAQMARERPGQTLQATALVHEAYLRMLGPHAGPAGRPNQAPPQFASPEAPTAALPHWNSRAHFFAAAAEAMRRILLDHARRRQADKRGGARRRLPLAEAVAPEQMAPIDLLALSDAIDRLNCERPQHVALVKLRFFAGLTLEEAAANLGISLATAKRHWTWARAWLFGQLNDASNEDA
ncbi:MAG: RNA polymerase subunit sigma [Pirellulales bacterium]|nr:RNA polymerase subunit sigma [Pirellulales bacterium]